MQLATIVNGERRTAVAVDDVRGVVRLTDLRPAIQGSAMAALSRLSPDRLRRRVAQADDGWFRSVGDVRFTAPYLRPRKIWGIGLNYREHAADLAATAPGDEPASFMKGDHTIVGPGDPIVLPWQSNRVTVEAELGLVIGRYCENVGVDRAMDYVWGVCPVLDQTAEDILQRNPRFLTRAKNFPSFFSFGPGIVPMDDVYERFADLTTVEVSTVVNGDTRRSNVVANMTFDPSFLVSFHSQVMPLFPGDIISTGTPGALQVHPGDSAECRIPGVGTLTNPVIGGGVRVHQPG